VVDVGGGRDAGCVAFDRTGSGAVDRHRRRDEDRGMIHTFDVSLPHGIVLSCRANQRSMDMSLDDRRTPRVMFLHGFPEGAFVWDEVIDILGARVQAVAPNLRGFERSSAPTGVAAYRAKHLVQDVVALVQRFGGEPIDLVVAHDWGGAVAWAMAARAPELLKRLLIVNAPHPATFLRELKHSPAQQAASAYMNFLCRPDAAALLAADDHARLWPFFTNMGGESWLDEATRERYREVWRHGLDGALNYYRASPLRPATDAQSAVHSVALEAKDVMVSVRTTILWGEADSALPPSLLDGIHAYVPRLEALHRVPHATHWIVHEQPDLVARVVIEALDRPG
jgi:epoxide hydrolase 4